MREDICSIPVNDVFLPKEGCPFCRMRDMLEDRMATYITGAAMMEPDVRVETNRLGFCHQHFEQILARGSRLSVALILESLLHTVEEEVFPQGKAQPKKIAAAAMAREDHCFICENIEKNMVHLTGSTLQLWQREEEFRRLYAAQPYLCLPHYAMVLQAAAKLPRKLFPQFEADTTRLAKAYLETSYMQPVSIQKLADTLHIDRRYLTVLFREAYGEPPQAYLMRLRLEQAREFLGQGYGVTEAAALAGFSDLSNFSRQYKRQFGASPSRQKRR